MNASSIGSLTVVGLGIQMAGHLTPESREVIEEADLVLYVGCDPLSAALLAEINPKALSLEHLYRFGRERRETYAAMVDAVCAAVRDGNDVCFAVYGHPGVFVTPTHEAVRQMRAEGHPARMLPGISATDCLYADLGFDPGDAGCQMYEATAFVTDTPTFDPTVPLILWQLGTIGERTGSAGIARDGLAELAQLLVIHYRGTHMVTAYHAAPFYGMRASITDTELSKLADADFPPLATLFVPPLS